MSSRVYDYFEESIILTLTLDAPLLFGSSQDDVRARLKSLKDTVNKNTDILKQRYGLRDEQLEQLKASQIAATNPIQGSDAP